MGSQELRHLHYPLTGGDIIFSVAQASQSHKIYNFNYDTGINWVIEVANLTSSASDTTAEGSAFLDSDEDTIHLFFYYYEHCIYYPVLRATGDGQASPLAVFDTSGNGKVLSLKQYENYVYLLFKDSNNYLSVYDKDTEEIMEERISN